MAHQNNHFLKRCAALAIALRDRYTQDIFIRTSAHIIAVHVLFTLIMLFLFWVMLQFANEQSINSISRYILNSIQMYPQGPPENLPEAISGVQSRIVRYAFLIAIMLSLAFGTILSYITLKPARKSLEFQKRFISNIAHELRTPLATIKTSTEVALFERGLSPDVRATFQTTVSELDRAGEIINNLLSFNALIRPERMEFKNTDLNAIADAAILAHLSLAKSRGIGLFNQSAKPQFVFGNPRALDQVVGNLLRNAINYTPKDRGGKVTVEIEPNYHGEMVLSVRDTGIGIAKKDLYHVFEPFYRGEVSRARGVGTGTSGLGLAIVKEIVELHGGKISVESGENRGTTISISLPVGGKNGR